MSTKGEAPVRAQVDADIEAAEKAAANFYAIADRPDPKVLVMLLVLEAQAVEAERWAKNVRECTLTGADNFRAHVIDAFESLAVLMDERAAELRRKAKELSA